MSVDPVPVLEVAAAIIEKEGKYLIARRCAGDHLGGLWEFPGGKREPGETLEECLKREIREELDVEIEVLRLWKNVRHAYPHRVVDLHFFRCRLVAGDPRPLGCETFCWAAPGELKSYEFPPADTDLIEELSRGLHHG